MDQCSDSERNLYWRCASAALLRQTSAVANIYFRNSCWYLCPSALGGQGDGGARTRQMKEAVFELKVKQDIQEEATNQLKW